MEGKVQLLTRLLEELRKPGRCSHCRVLGGHCGVLRKIIKWFIFKFIERFRYA